MFSVSELKRYIKKNKLRALLTGFGVAWGIFILVILLGLSSGFEQGVFSLFKDYSQNSVWVYGGWATKAVGNYPANRSVYFEVEKLKQLNKTFTNIEHSCIEQQVGNQRSFYNTKFHNTSVSGVDEHYFKVKLLQLEEGRLINKADLVEARDVAVIGHNVANILFDKGSAIGKQLRVGEVFFKVVGVLVTGSMLSQQSQDAVYIPITACQINYNLGHQPRVIGISLKAKADTKTFEEHYKQSLAKIAHFDLEDKNAVFIYNMEEQIKSFRKLFDGLNIFFWFIGLCLLLSGIIGVSNIMFVVVNERTREIGIRKAIGAKKKAILGMILSESLMITLLSGSGGILLGVFVLKMIDWLLPSLMGEDFIITQTSLNYGAALLALLILISSGVLAGILPAKKATEIKPIEAINSY